jgi:hypothetical protein
MLLEGKGAATICLQNFWGRKMFVRNEKDFLSQLEVILTHQLSGTWGTYEPQMSYCRREGW